MKSAQEIENDLVALERNHYYSEDFEWLSAVRAYRDSLSEAERETLSEAVLRRLLKEGSMTDILLCSIIPVPSAAPVLAAKLDREFVPSQLTRALITALSHYKGDDVFRAVARFVDSDQENEALRTLALIDFAKALPYVARALLKEHQADLVLHILHDRYKTHPSIERLAAELRAFAAGWGDPDFVPRLRRALTSKREPYNPFTIEELTRLDALLATG